MGGRIPFRTPVNCDHSSFNYKCKECLKIKTRNQYNRNKNIIINCEICKKEVNKNAYRNHRHSDGHRMALEKIKYEDIIIGINSSMAKEPILS